MKRICAALLLVSTFVAGKNQIVAFTHTDLPPLVYLEENAEAEQVQGTLVTRVEQLFEQLFEHANIELKLFGLPFARSYRQVLNTPNSMSFPINRTKEREDKFIWVGPITPPLRMHLYHLKSRPELEGKNWEQIKTHLVGVVRDFSSHQLLKQQGFIDGINLYPVTSMKHNVERFLAGRVDYILGYQDADGVFIESHGLKPQVIQMAVFLASTSDMYLAFNKNTSPEIISKLNNSLVASKEQAAN